MWTAQGAEGRGTRAPGPHTHQVKDVQVVAIFRREAGVCV